MLKVGRGSKVSVHTHAIGGARDKYVCVYVCVCVCAQGLLKNFPCPALSLAGAQGLLNHSVACMAQNLFMSRCCLGLMTYG
jgi:hypothetical protein